MMKNFTQHEKSQSFFNNASANLPRVTPDTLYIIELVLWYFMIADDISFIDNDIALIDDDISMIDNDISLIDNDNSMIDNDVPMTDNDISFASNDRQL